MITLLAVLVGGAIVIDQAALLLIADVKLAMKRADLSLDWVARTIRVPGPKLSDQLNGKAPFTAFWRFGIGEMRATDFWLEFSELQLGRVGRVSVPRDLGALLDKVNQLADRFGPVKPRMAKADLPDAQKVKAS